MLRPSARQLGGGHLHGHAAVRRRRLRAPREVTFTEDGDGSRTGSRMKTPLKQVSTRRRRQTGYSRRDERGALGRPALRAPRRLTPGHGFKGRAPETPVTTCTALLSGIHAVATREIILFWFVFFPPFVFKVQYISTRLKRKKTELI